MVFGLVLISFVILCAHVLLAVSSAGQFLTVLCFWSAVLPLFGAQIPLFSGSRCVCQ